MEGFRWNDTISLTRNLHSRLTCVKKAEVACPTAIPSHSLLPFRRARVVERWQNRTRERTRRPLSLYLSYSNPFFLFLLYLLFLLFLLFLLHLLHCRKLCGSYTWTSREIHGKRVYRWHIVFAIPSGHVRLVYNGTGGGGKRVVINSPLVKRSDRS